MDLLISKAAGVFGVHEDLFRIAFCIIASFPLASLVKRVPLTTPILKDFAILSIGVFYLCGIFNLYKGTLLLVGLSTVTYGLATGFRKYKWMPWVNFGFQMSAMLATHCYEQFGGDDFVNEIGISGSQMIALQKLTSFAWDMYDGSRPESELGSHQKTARILEAPSFTRYLSWIFFFPTILTGPACTFVEYNDWFKLTMFGSLKTDVHSLPRSGFVVLGLKLVEGLFWVSLYTQSTSISLAHDFAYHDWYKSLPFWGRVGYIYILGVAFRTKYYAAWTLAEAACIHSGLGFNGVDPQTGKLKWDRMRNVKALKVEGGQNIHNIFANWNIITAKWLRFYVYERVTPRDRKPGVSSTFITFLVSALWHGTRPGYYITFITGAVYQTFGKVYRRQIRPVFLGTKYKPVYDAFTWFATQLGLCYAALPFIVLELKPTFYGWYSVYFYAYVALLVSWFFLLGPGRPVIMPKLKVMHRDIKRAE